MCIDRWLIDVRIIFFSRLQHPFCCVKCLLRLVHIPNCWTCHRRSNIKITADCVFVSPDLCNQRGSRDMTWNHCHSIAKTCKNEDAPGKSGVDGTSGMGGIGVLGSAPIEWSRLKLDGGNPVNLLVHSSSCFKLFLFFWYTMHHCPSPARRATNAMTSIPPLARHDHQQTCARTYLEVNVRSANVFGPRCNAYGCSAESLGRQDSPHLSVDTWDPFSASWTARASLNQSIFSDDVKTYW